MRRPPWAASTTARRWLVVGAALLLLISGRVATHSFDTQTVLSDGAKAYATCKAPWRSAVVAPPHQRFTLWVMTGGTGQRRAEGVVTLGARCRTRARARLAFAASLLAVTALCAWLALPPRRPRSRPPPPAPAA
jgi:disulfide bond formation protein DsbB